MVVNPWLFWMNTERLWKWTLDMRCVQQSGSSKALAKIIYTWIVNFGYTDASALPYMPNK